MNIQVKKNNSTHDTIICKENFTFRPNKKWIKKPTVIKGKKSIVWYMNSICCLDTETSKINIGTTEEEKWLGWVYQWCICIDDDFCIGRTPTQLLDVLDEVEKMYGLNDTHKMVIYIHNLSYDMQYLIRFLYERDCDTEMFLLDSRKILTVKYKHFEFRDSYRLSNMSLEKWCESLHTDIKKAVGTIDYDIVRFQDDVLTYDDWFYQVNDVASMKECIEIEMRENNDNIVTIPLTSTGYVRRDCRNVVKNDIEYRHFFDKIRLDNHLYTACQLAFCGGYCHANRNIINKVVCGRIGHNDKKSFYPSKQQLGYYPISKFTKSYVWKQGEKLISVDNFSQLKTDCCLMKIAIKNCKIHDYVTAPYLQVSKIFGDFTKLKTDNGRVLQFTGTAVIWLTELDFDIIKSQYEADFYMLELNTSVRGRFPEQFRKVIDKYFEAKETLKKEGGYFYMKSKNKLNSIYGMSVSRLIRENICYDVDSATYNKKAISDTEEREKILNKYYNSKKSFFPYQLGIYVTANCRNELLHIISDVIGYENFLYSDTDSVFYIDSEEVQKRLKKHNEEVIEKNIKLGLGVKHDGKTSYYNLFEAEEKEGEKIVKFKTLHSKCYAFVDEKSELHVTIAGVAKDNKKTGKDKITNSMELGCIENLDDDFIFHECGGTLAKYVCHDIDYVDINGHITELSDACIILNTSKQISKLSDDFELYDFEED